MTVRAARFASFHDTPASLRILKWVLVPFIAVHVVLATISGYRAIVQVYHVEIGIDSTRLRPGSTIAMHVATSGRTPVDAELELIQAARVETLAVLLIHDHRNASYDPRTIHASRRVVLTADEISHFAPGPALLRVTANGRSQWLRVPPPVIVQRSVQIEERAPPAAPNVAVPAQSPSARSR